MSNKYRHLEGLESGGGVHLSILGVREDGHIRVPILLVLVDVAPDTCNERPVE